MLFALTSIKCLTAPISILPASDFCRARSDQIVEYSSDNETKLGSSQKVGKATEHLVDGNENLICRLTIEF